MGYKNYLKVSQNASNQIFGVQRGSTPLSMLISYGAKFNSNRTAVIVFGIITLIAGVILSSVPWLNYFILKNLRLWNDTLSFQYWQRPGVIRLTKVYIFNVTNPEGFLNGEKPRLVEVGPFVYREDMEKVNIKFHDNFTVSYQHNKILQFVPELSVDKNLRIITPNIPLLTLSSYSNNLGYFVSKTISLMLTAAKYKPFVSLTADELVFGYDDTLVSLAHKFYPRNMRPLAKMGLLNKRNGTMTEIATINTGLGEGGMHKFGYIDRLNGLDRLPYWRENPCMNISASEGSFFPPRELTKSDTVYVYDRDLCRIIPLKYTEPVVKDGIDADLYTLPKDVFGGENTENQCFNDDSYKAEEGVQNISPCQHGAPVFISNPHFYQANPKFINEIEGLEPKKELHETYFKIQPKIGVPVEGKVRVQLNLKVEQAQAVQSVANFRDFMFPIMWLEEGISELTPPIRRWVYLGTVFAPTAIPILSYGMIVGGAFIIIFVFVRAYKNFVFASDPTADLLEMGRKSLRRGSSLIKDSNRILSHRDSYHLLKTPKTLHSTASSIVNKHHLMVINSSTESNDEESS